MIRVESEEKQDYVARMASSSSPFLKKEPMVLSELVRFRPSIRVETVKASALIGLHKMIEEKSGRSENGSSVSSSSSDENNVGNDALFVIGLHGSGDTIALVLQDWEVAKVALSCHIALGHGVPGIVRSRKETWVVWFLSSSWVLQKGKEMNDMSF